MEFLLEIAGFTIKAGILTVAIGAVVLIIASALRRQGDESPGHLSVIDLSDHYHNLADSLRRETMDPKQYKAFCKEAKQKDKEREKEDTAAKRVFVIEFHGDIAATAVADLREQVSAILTVAEKEDEVLVRLESNGGMVHQYGLAAAQLVRLREKSIPLTVCIDKVAASGGYLMACVANKITASPFAIVGSIGVIAMFPNFHRLLKKYDVDYLELTAGEFKRTLSPLGEITEKGRDKFQSELEETHELFKHFLAKYRPSLNLAEIATGETWYGSQALDKHMIDEIMTSDDYLMCLGEEATLFKVDFHAGKSVREKLASTLTKSADHLMMRWWERLEERVRARS